MNRIGQQPAMRLKYTCNRGNKVRRSLYRHSLHIMFYAAHTAHLLPATGPAGAACTSCGSGDPWPVLSLAQAAFSSRILPCWLAASITYCFAWNRTGGDDGTA